jgi:mannose-6-phosphate isomerase-like protein (cupin superfamily)
METTTSSTPTVLDAASVDALPLEPLGSLRGVMHKVLWRNDTSMAGVLTVDAGHRLGTHAHHANHHHIWVLDGRAMILGRDLGAGSYVHIPSGVDHDIDATGSDGCTVFYLYVRQAN